MGGEVIDDDMNVEVGRHALIDLAYEGDEVDASMLTLASRNHRSLHHVECCKQVERSVANVVVSPALGLTEVHRQPQFLLKLLVFLFVST